MDGGGREDQVQVQDEFQRREEGGKIKFNFKMSFNGGRREGSQIENKDEVQRREEGGEVKINIKIGLNGGRRKVGRSKSSSRLVSKEGGGTEDQVEVQDEFQWREEGGKIKFKFKMSFNGGRREGRSSSNSR